MGDALLWFEPKSKKLQAVAEATGNGNAFDLEAKYGTLTAQVSGTFEGTVTFEGSEDGDNFIAIRGINKNSGIGSTTTTAAGLFQFSVAGLQYFRARVSAYTSGEITVTATAIPAAEPSNKAATTEVTGMGEVDADPTANTLLARLKSIEDKLDGTLSTEVTGSIPEYSWLDGAAEPTPTEDFAWGYKFNSTTGALTVYGWSGSAWVEVV